MPRLIYSSLFLAIVTASLLSIFRPPTISAANAQPTFYKDILPILQNHCQSCHRPGEVAPMPLVTYEQAKPFAPAIAATVQTKMMPPWFADPAIGHFADDPSLTAKQIESIVAWAKAGAPAGNPKDALPSPHWTDGWNIAHPDKIFEMPQLVPIPADGDIEYTYEIAPTHFTKDRWVQMSEVRPSSPQYVHHAVVYIRPPNSSWLRHAPVGVPFTASDLQDPIERREAHETTNDLLLVYAPGSSPDQWPQGMAKFIPAGSDLVFQMHYTSNGHAGADQTALGIVFAKQPPAQRVITLQLNDHALLIPPNVDNFRVEVQGTLPNNATLLSFFPHMHLRGKAFEYDIVHDDGTIEPLLRVDHYHFHWQLSYKLAQPRFLKADTRLRAVAWYDNSRNNPHNPDPDALVTWGDQTYQEMMVGFFDVAVPANVDKQKFFIRKPAAQPPD